MRIAKFGDLGLLNGLVLLRIAVPLALVDRVIRLKLQILLIDDKERLPRRSSSTRKFLSHRGEQPHCVCVPIELQILYYAREASQWSYEPLPLVRPVWARPAPAPTKTFRFQEPRRDQTEPPAAYQKQSSTSRKLPRFGFSWRYSVSLRAQ